MHINVQGEMLRLAGQSVDRYCPKLGEHHLKEETGRREPSLANIRQLRKPKEREVVAIYWKPGACGTVFVFDTGESYLALGLRPDDPELRRGLAEIMAEITSRPEWELDVELTAPVAGNLLKVTAADVAFPRLCD